MKLFKLSDFSYMDKLRLVMDAEFIDSFSKTNEIKPITLINLYIPRDLRKLKNEKFSNSVQANSEIVLKIKQNSLI
ncbi:MAG: hypothetical protein CBD16_03900 [Betaproteobacteria bacterium TMED156]|nr:MAG: hypothetical protein CBD16_03900 [Betaproteobacteria bacterium TMED156]